tara:strand:- start:452 stop:631 length:180 start_codon:yes stop_codon:yes gene_type:complete
MTLKRKTIIENIYRLNYDEIINKDSHIKWREILQFVAELNDKELLQYYIKELQYKLETI